MKVTLMNDFHDTSVTVQVSADGVLSAGQTRRVYRQLCGIEGCLCGGVRGPQPGVPRGFRCSANEVQDRLAIVADPED